MHAQSRVTSSGNAASPGAVGMSLPHVAAEEYMYFSKPGILQEQPCSEVPFSSEDLEISHAPTGTKDSLSGHPVRATPVFNPQRAMEIAGPCCSVTSDELMLSNSTISTNSDTNAVENSTPRDSCHLNNGIPEIDTAPNQPEETYYESVSQNMQTISEILEHNVEYSELPSQQNLSQPVHTNCPSVSLYHNSEAENRGQSSVLENQYGMQVNNYPASWPPGSAADTAAYAVSANRLESRLNVSGNNVPSQSELRDEPQGLLNKLQFNYCLIAATVGLAAICIAWKLK